MVRAGRLQICGESVMGEKEDSSKSPVCKRTDTERPT